ncbi:RsmB/NOP family class I SAM-dependent RNA methyltransferase [Phaeobacter gallaeciensis]|uniref:tRNA and rRNA cytosine-C5-methylase n=1 Tax=Phaeobacter gallaeciensis TaxID=60890 RepID=A0AAC9Z8G6_9RHOB|nr:RsmB/NOP family class I SAM-dependent RNA methyltransferase [Phaeobacter gallaeciensis]AHD09632.1 tRNA and rRNA cytosine-C5-methylase [Phaeobacter gallaeciensis DSM 26640]ATE92896.1 tRNA and rRNA cytosine-C5-methylase [Phaeobacter gallaeciensis]ATE97282.1 tRNA and rRNA cytosine-C5-methylase [Phaeobacter gallaeciensis]ATF01561.1 tRNA and rRNA cytosine-C5-methylase [Phaeobacter gallaeciensis]ATF05941.1 tRNA and rRNA cytosine-C5-methylase [Phaeobacter gallaeciensis]
MTPAARRQAAIEILDQILTGQPAEKELTAWARRSRFAGSKDRAAVRDHVFDALRCLRSFAALGGGGGDNKVTDANTTGRQLTLGALRAEDIDPADIFTGVGHAPKPLETAEQELLTTRPEMAQAESVDMPDWLWPAFAASLGEAAEVAARALQQRAPVHLRVNRSAADRDTAIAALAEEGILAETHPAADTALSVTEGARKIRNSSAYLTGLVELQDAASQAVIEALPLADGQRVLDYCAGGGGKSLAIAARAKLAVFAHDIAPQRMKDLPTRADRAGAAITVLAPDDVAAKAPFDLVLCDAPCSGSGSWRRAPEGKWRLTQARLDELCQTQAQILQDASQLVGPGGTLAYATCSMLNVENGDQVAAFLAANPEWQLQQDHGWQVQDGTDGFYVAVLSRFGDD